MRRRINTRPWKRPPWRRRSSKPGEWLTPSESSANSLGLHSPWGIPVEVDWPGIGFSPYPDTAIDVSQQILLSSAVEDSLLGQPIWPKHTVQHITGEIMIAPVPIRTQTGEDDSGPFMLHLGIRKFRYNDVISVPSFEIDGDPGAPDEADSRWIWRKHVWIPPCLRAEQVGAAPFYSVHQLGPTGNAVILTRDPWALAKVKSLSLNVKNRVRIEQDEGLLLIMSTSGSPSQLSASSAFGELDGQAGKCVVLPFLRSYIVADR